MFLIFSDFFREQQYKNKYLVLVIIIYLILPYILQYILVFIHDSYIYLKEYHNLQEDVISYPYIVDDNSHKKYEPTPPPV